MTASRCQSRRSWRGTRTCVSNPAGLGAADVCARPLAVSHWRGRRREDPWHRRVLCAVIKLSCALTRDAQKEKQRRKRRTGAVDAA
ncbi:hypothetical protein PAL_GLEAN10003644 [Pteropus alecto]|uniref:Uncharacterized protein n=1 Tax=Pteropus alecto TaxID=9402 RepID=L5L712_PTEAL|nr:hypothetical protein PAL_GLEAN10003644 [Pteropus alecto]